MNDENKVPVPDEAQASPAHAEDDIATLEREARAKREAELLNAQDDEEKDPVQPAVNKLKKRKRGKATVPVQPRWSGHNRDKRPAPAGIRLQAARLRSRRRLAGHRVERGRPGHRLRRPQSPGAGPHARDPQEALQ